MSEVQDIRELTRKAQTAISRVNELSSDVDQVKAQGAKVIAASAKLDQDMVVVRCVMQQASELRTLIGQARKGLEDGCIVRLGAVEEELANASKRLADVKTDVDRIVELSEVPDEPSEFEATVQRHERMLQTLNERLCRSETRSEHIQTVLEHSNTSLANEYAATKIRMRKLGVADMRSNELADEVCKVLDAVLDDFEGDDSGLINYGENRAKDLLAEIRRRGQI